MSRRIPFTVFAPRIAGSISLVPFGHTHQWFQEARRTGKSMSALTAQLVQAQMGFGGLHG